MTSWTTKTPAEIVDDLNRFLAEEPFRSANSVTKPISVPDLEAIERRVCAAFALAGVLRPERPATNRKERRALAKRGGL